MLILQHVVSSDCVVKTQYFYQQIALFGESFSRFLWDHVHAISFEFTLLRNTFVCSVLIP